MHESKKSEYLDPPKKSIRNYFHKIADIKKMIHKNVDIMLNHNNKIICNDHELVKLFNKHYINIIE